MQVEQLELTLQLIQPFLDLSEKVLWILRALQVHLSKGVWTVEVDERVELEHAALSALSAMALIFTLTVYFHRRVPTNSSKAAV